MHRRQFLKISGAVIGASLLPRAGIAAEAAASARPAPAPVPSASAIAFGAYISGAPADPTQIDQFAALVGVAPAIVMCYQGWANSVSRDFNAANMDAIVARNAMPMVTWEPWDYTAGVSQPAFALKNIIGGAYDTFIHAWAHSAAAWGKPLYLRFAHEMNGNWYPWCIGVNGNTAAQYVSAWKHIYDIFRQEGATNVRWVWSPNVGGTKHGRKGGSASTLYNTMYPGDAYVNWVGIDGYNWGTTQSWSSWTDLTTVFGTTYSSLAKLTSKPMMIAETASTEVGGNKAAWISQGLANDLPTRFPRIGAVIWFNENKETDWRVNSSTTALAAYASIAKSAIYQGRLT
jgi:beta-mannanase